MSAFRPEGEGWQRLDPRNLLLGGFKALREMAVPAFAGVIGLLSSGNWEWVVAGLPLVLLALMALTVLPWLATWFRVTPERLELHTGVFNKTKRSASLERVRSVDLTASLIQRLIGMRKVEIGTGVDSEQFSLDALPVLWAESLREHLLTRRAPATTVSPGSPAAEPESTGTNPYDPAPVVAPPAPVEPPVELAHFTWSWARFAPFSLTRLVVLLAAVGFLMQFVDDIPGLEPEDAESAVEWASGFALWLVIVVVIVGFVGLWVLVAVVEYVAKWWGLKLVRERGNLNLSAGLFSTRSTSLEERRIRGLNLSEPPLVRLIGGAELSVMTTGLSDNTPKVLPLVPRAVARRVGGVLLDDQEALEIPLARHGAKAFRRTLIAHQGLTELMVWVALVFWFAPLPAEVHEYTPAWVPWLVLGVCFVGGLLTGVLTYGNLGHAVTPHHVVVGSGTFVRRRQILEHDGVIGWVLKQSFFQRFSGLVDLVITTAAGGEHVTLPNVAMSRALWISESSLPGTVAQFRVDVPPARDGRDVRLGARPEPRSLENTPRDQT